MSGVWGRGEGWVASSRHREKRSKGSEPGELLSCREEAGVPGAEGGKDGVWMVRCEPSGGRVVLKTKEHSTDFLEYPK